MSKHARKSDHLQLVEPPKTATVEVPLPLLGAFTHIERSFFELCIDAGQQVLAAMMEQDREDLCGPRGKRDPERRAGRAGTTQSEVTLGGRRIALRRPRVRSQVEGELALPSFAFASDRDPLDRHALDAIACGVSTRKYARSLDRLPEAVDERSVSKSSVSRRYVAMTAKQMTTWLTKPLGDRHFPVVMIDGIVLGDHTVLIALGIDLEGKKQVLGLREGDTENSRVAKALLRDLVERGLDPERARLFVIDGAKALRSGIRKVFGDLGVVQRCQIHKRRNILGHLPDGMVQSVKTILEEAWGLGDAKLAKARLERLASSLEADHPGAAASVREGLDETLTLQGLGIEGTLYRKLRSTNAIENLNSGIVSYSKNVKRWQGGSMVVRWVSAAIVEAEKKFRRVQGWRDIEKLARALTVFEAKEEAAAERVA
ncbi:MAG: IS256 family transposase [Proteobacteria bacterium]|nr:IS256 family transposase [Pseudomonadota bacterium]